MQHQIRIHRETCNACGICEDICPNRIMKKDGNGEIYLHPDRLHLCIKCGQCMAI
ncbi:MAG: hypothetical protein FJZ87_16465 [Chloroflexi bacterium]|nr:hypothetical protein [Chloroflexota bacterium]